MVALDDLTPRPRLLDTASRLFDQEGIRAIGINRLIAEANVARASLYRTFGSKDGLIVAYLDRQDTMDRERYRQAAAQLTDPISRVLVVFDLAEASARRRDFRGCLYLNALVEFPDPAHPIRNVVDRHRNWLATQWATELRSHGVDEPDSEAARLHVLYDGGLAGSTVARSVEPIELAKRMAEVRLRRW
jgi:AcrR family transcriptional regulator